MAEKRVSVRLAVVGGREVRAELQGIGDAGEQGFRRLSREMDAANSRVAAFYRRVQIAAAAAATAFAAGAAAMIRSGLQVVDAQAKLAQSLGTTVESIQVLERAGELAGVSMSGIEQATKDLTRRLSQAAAGTGPAVAALERLGLSASALLALPLDERVGRINQAKEARTRGPSCRRQTLQRPIAPRRRNRRRVKASQAASITVAAVTQEQLVAALEGYGCRVRNWKQGQQAMATADHVKALIRSHAEGDDERFYAIAMQVAAQAARQGHTKFAQELRDLVDQAKARAKAVPSGQRTKPVPIIQPRGELAGLLTAAFPKGRLSDMALGEAIRSRIDRILLEQRQRETILAHGMSPLRKLLLVGPPGTGKTMTAAALAGELSVPLFTIQLDGLITKYLGETAAKLRLIFESIQQTRAVYLFDEFDALGGERAARNEVGEIRRVLNSFLQFLEQDDSDSIIVAATNHPQILDRALFRRFDSVIEYRLPSEDIAEKVMRSRLALLDTSQVEWNKAVEAAERLSHSDITRACEHAAKNAILQHHTRIDTAELIEALIERRAAHQ